MSLYRIQGLAEKRKGIYYEFDPLEEPLGEGGMGKVFQGRCVDENNGSSRDVAIKFMYNDLSAYAIEKARREAAIHIRHDNLIEMLGFIETESKTVLGETTHNYHVVSELLEGVALDKMFEGRLTDQRGRFVPFAERLYRDYQQDVNHFAVELIKNILSGLMTMHDAGYIHRDIDPTNIMLTSNGKIKLIDFGIAKKMNTLTTNDKHLTQAGQFVGKPEYAAPELVLGSINEQNQTTDIYAVGILMYQCIVGHVPFEGDRAEILQKQVHSPMPLNVIKHKGLRKIIEMATEKSRSKRFQSAAEFRVALDRLNLDGDTGFEWNPRFNYVLGGVLVCGLAFGIYRNWPKSVTTIDPPVEVTKTYSDAIQQIKDNGDLTLMKQLAEANDVDATYFLSRLYFKSRSQTTSQYNFQLDVLEYCPDSMKVYQNMLNVVDDNVESDRLLRKTLSLNPNHYQALFELACDYWRSDDRSEVIKNRDGEKAELCFNKARKYAQEVNDIAYVGMIDAYLKRIEEWKKIANKK